MSLTPAELAALRAYAQTGDLERAAVLLGISRDALRGRLARMRAREGVDSTVVLLWRYRDRLAA